MYAWVSREKFFLKFLQGGNTWDKHKVKGHKASEYNVISNK